MTAWRVRIEGVAGGTLRGRADPGDGPPPHLVLSARGTPVAEVRLAPDAAGWALAATVPGAVLEEGVTLLAIEDLATGAVLARHPVAVGRGVAEDVLAAIAGLEADLAALRRAFLTAMADPPLTRAERPLLLAEAVEAMAALLAEPAPPPAPPAAPWRPLCPLPRRRARPR